MSSWPPNPLPCSVPPPRYACRRHPSLMQSGILTLLWLDTSILVSTLTNCCCSSPRCPSRSVLYSSTGLINRSVFFHSPFIAPLSGTILLIFLLLPLSSSSLPAPFHLCPPLSPRRLGNCPAALTTSPCMCSGMVCSRLPALLSSRFLLASHLLFVQTLV